MDLTLGTDQVNKNAVFFTPSYRQDLERVRVLRESIRHCFDGAARHVVAVPAEDMNAFKSAFLGDSVELVAQNDLVEKYYYGTRWARKLGDWMPNQRWRFAKWQGTPGWFIQQVVKLAAPDICPEEVIVALDSDVAFIRAFSLSDLGLSGERRVLTRIVSETESGKHRKHLVKARQLLGLPPGSTEHHYMSCPAVLYSDWLLRLREYLEAQHEKPWQRVLKESGVFSEYSLYGIFVEEIEKPADLSTLDRNFSYIVWDRSSAQRLLSGKLFDRSLAPFGEKLAVVFQSNLGINSEEYEEVLRSQWSMIS